MKFSTKREELRSNPLFTHSDIHVKLKKERHKLVPQALNYIGIILIFINNSALYEKALLMAHTLNRIFFSSREMLADIYRVLYSEQLLKKKNTEKLACCT